VGCDNPHPLRQEAVLRSHFSRVAGSFNQQEVERLGYTAEIFLDPRGTQSLAVCLGME